jgi:hypothetical protein
MMIKGLSVCAVSLILGTPALAEKRHDNAASPGRSGVKVETAPVQSVRGRGPTGRSFNRFALPIHSLKLERRAIPSGLGTFLPRRADQPFNLAQGDPQDTPQTSLRLSETTSDDGARHAVDEALSNHRKPRVRRSALGTMLTLRLDGEEESPPFSVGGGGVAAVVWQAVPKP